MRAIRRIEKLARRDDELAAVEVWLFELVRASSLLIRQVAAAFRGRPGHFVLVFTTDFASLDVALLESVLPDPSSKRQVTMRPWVITLQRTAVGRVPLRILRRVTFTEETGDAQHEKMLAAFQSADWSREWFHNRNLFSDHFLESRLPARGTDLERAAKHKAFAALLAQARSQLAGQIEHTARTQLLVPALRRLGFDPREAKGPTDSRRDSPDYWLHAPSGARVGLCLTYPYARSLDGSDEVRDTQTSEEDPVAVVVHLLKEPASRVSWAVVTNGKQWRLYSRRADSIATSYLEVDVEEILAASDGASGFRLFWTLFHCDAFTPGDVTSDEPPPAALDRWFDESRAFAAELEADLKARVYERAFPAFAQGFLRALQAKEAKKAALPDERLQEVFEGTLTLLYRVLFVLYAEARDLLPVRDVRGYRECSLLRLREEVAVAAGDVEDQVEAGLRAHYSERSFALYDRLLALAKVIAEGDPARNVPLYNGGLFNTSPAADDDSAEARGARFLNAWKVDDVALAIGLDALTRTLDRRTHGLVTLDYRDLGVRQLGSIYEGLLEHRLVMEKGAAVLSSSDDRRHATGSFYTPEHLVRFVVEQSVGPVMRAHLRAMAARFEDARQKKVTGAALLDELFDLTVVDPAMGSGHFLVTAIDWITDELVAFLAAHPHSPLQAELARTREAILAEVEAQGVSIDTHQLTDLALVRRFILKRCVFGVDLNPMAVELAKVSIWLHCFTLGAPLSLLDHHLRCGNALAGVTVAEVREASSVRQQSLFDQDNFGSLEKATRSMRAVVRMPDLTPAEAKRSRKAYREALVELRALKRLLDVFAAHYLLPVKAGERVNDHHPVVAFLSTGTAGQMARAKDPIVPLAKLDPSTRERVTKALGLAAEHRFFHWELEFPEVFYRANRKAKVRGFDAVIGNPPWIRQESIKALKGLLAKVHDNVFHTVADLYVSFLGRARFVLRGGGHLGMVLPNKWFRADYAVKLRATLAHPKHFHPRVVVDFGHAPTLFEADTFPCILIAERAGADVGAGVAETQPLRFCHVADSAHGAGHFESWFNAQCVDVNSKRLLPSGWELLVEDEGALMDHLRRVGSPLKDHVGSAPLYGVKTGDTAAFQIRQETRDALVAQDPASRNIIRKCISGTDVDRWRSNWGGEWMIALASSENVAWPWAGIDSTRNAEAVFKREYPALHAHMKGRKARLEARTDQGAFWWELRSCAYYELFDKPKIMYMDMAFGSGFAFDTERLYANNTCYFIASDDKVLLACLNSAIAWWYFWRAAIHGKTETLRLHSTYVEQFPVPKVSAAKRKALTGIVDRLLAMADRQRKGESSFAKCLTKRTGLGKVPNKLAMFWTLDGEGFLDAVREAKGKVPPGEGRASLLSEFEGHRAELREVRQQACVDEVALQWTVCDLYGLSPEEVALMRRTAPPRDPWALIDEEIRACGYRSA